MTQRPDGGRRLPAEAIAWGLATRRHRPTGTRGGRPRPVAMRGPQSTSSSSYPAGHFLVRLDGAGADPAYVRSVGGGAVKAAVLSESVGPEAWAFKHLGALEVEPIELEIGMAQARPLLEWIRGSWRREPSRRDGTVIHADARLEPRLEQDFFAALITETRFPVLDGAAREPAYLGVTFHPERVELRRVRGPRLVAAIGDQQKRWLPSSFRLEIDGLDCSRVNRIESFSVKQTVRPLQIGGQRLPELEPVSLELSNLTVLIAAEHAGPFMAWHEDAVVRGRRGGERDGVIELLSPDRREVLLGLRLDRLGIFDLRIERSVAGAESIKRARIELHVEHVDLELGGTRSGAQAARASIT
jgi:hypothetical protein